MEAIPHILSPLSAGWVSWTMLMLLVSGILAEYIQPGIIGQAGSSLVVRSERTYKEAPMSFWGQFYIHLFRIGTLSMSICTCFYAGDFRFVEFLAVCGIIIGVLLFKAGCHALVDYTFQLSRRYSQAREHYSNIETIASVVLYPLLLIELRIGDPIIGRWMIGCVMIGFFAMWVYRGGRLFIDSPLAILYFGIYICTMEFLPLAVLLYLSEQTIQIL